MRQPAASTGSMLTSQQLPPRAAVMRNYLLPGLGPIPCGGHYKVSSAESEWKGRDGHPSSICSLNPTLTWIMSYVKSCHTAVPTLSAGGVSSGGAQAADSGIIPLYSTPAGPRLSREALPADCGARWREGLTGSLRLDTLPKDHSGIN